MNDTIDKYLLPTRVRVEYDINEATGKLERISYVECKNGELLTNSVPFDWAHYISNALNRRYIAQVSKGFNVSNPIAVLRINGIPQEKALGQAVALSKDGGYRIEDSPPYRASIEQAALLGEEIFLNRWTQLPITEPISVACMFYSKGKHKYNLALCTAWVLDLLYGLNIIKSTKANQVKRTDGSKFCKVTGDPYTIVVIRKCMDT